MDPKRFIVSADFGTASVRCFVYDLSGNVVARAHEKVTLLYPHQGWCEIDPEELWNTFQSVFKRALEGLELTLLN
jgi:glycerol kinase